MNKTITVVVITVAAVIIVGYLYFQTRPESSDLRSSGVYIPSEDVFESDRIDEVKARRDFTGDRVPIVVSSKFQSRKDPFSPVGK